MLPFLLPFTLCLITIAAAGTLMRVQARTHLLAGHVGRGTQLLAGLILGSGLWGAQILALRAQALHAPAPAAALHWLVSVSVATGFLLWYRHHALDRPARVTVTLLLTVTAAQIAGLSGYPLPLTTAHAPQALSLYLLGALGALAAATLTRRPGLSRAGQLGAVTLGQSLSVTLITLAAASLLPAGTPVPAATLPALALGTAAALFLTVAAALLGDMQQRRAARLATLVAERTAELRAERDFHVALLDSLNDEVIISGADGQLIQHNSAAAQLHRAPLTGTLAPDWAATYGLHTPDFTRLLRAGEVPLARALNGETVRAALIGIEGPEGQRIVSCNATPVRAGDGQISGAVVAMNDVTTREQAGQELARTAAQHAQILDSLDEGLLLLDPDGRVLSRNGRVRELLGPHSDAATTLAELLAPLTVRDPQGRVLRGKSPNFRALLGGEVRSAQSIMHVERPDGRHLWLHSRAQATLQGTEVSGALYLLRDVTDTHELHAQLTRVTRYAPLTALPNRAHFEDLAATLPAPDGRTLLVTQCLNITDLRAVPGTLADDLTLAFTAALRRSYPDALLTGQLDERTFALILPGPETRLRGALLDPIPLRGEQVFPRVRACARPWPAAEALGTTLHAAETTLSVAPEGTLLPAEDHHVQDRQRRVHLEGALRRALATADFRVHYQPIIELTSGAIVKAEALIRWTDPVAGRVPPDVFVPLAEQLGQIHVITDHVIHAALREARRASLTLNRTVRIAVNLSPSELNAPDFMDRMHRLIHDHPDAARHLAFEVTESGALINLEQTARHLTTLREWGFGLALDDFGTGHSALSLLQHLPIHHLKLDRTFVWGIEGNDRLQILTGAVMELATRLNFAVVAEGIETTAHEAILREMGCTLGQGYLYSPPQAQPDWAALDGWATTP
ncbi:EAL domain-containing protein [Deinococcus sp. JMULE3]|uniref:EAL domain-containing protein n=1 Tax=Deinococcus sp. JMULE3 TaxID=2518341 RepID=UPI00157566D1|nr:EAL domain-containing protein [Deinococcus sp. JMULE3]NTX98890.1 EAL domain-containing protein [Deinococcus sp. JMULE3]